MTERWKAYNEDYLVSNQGRWYSLKNRKILRQYPNNKGYLRVSIFDKGNRIQLFTHITVVALFGDKFGNTLPESSMKELKLSIDHLNRDKNNNARSNLELVTHQENCLRRSQKGARK